MRVQIKRIDTKLPLPEYKTSGAVAFDFISRVEMEIQPRQISLVPTNIIVKVPTGYVLHVQTRSSTPIKKGLIVPNAPGIIDQDYHGPEDEIKIQMLNILNVPVKIERGERIAQGTFIRVDQANWDESEGDLKTESRGGFGTTGQI